MRLTTRKRRIFQVTIAVSFLIIISLLFTILSREPKTYWRIRTQEDVAETNVQKAEESLEIVEITLNEQQPSIIESIRIPCETAFSGDDSAIDYMSRFAFDRASLQKLITASPDRCHTYRTAFGFAKSNPSEEEKEFPLAYAVLAHDNFDQLLLMLSSFYEEHNAFCISVPSSSDLEFFRLVESLAGCFENIHVMEVGRVSWASYEILRATHGCMQYLIEKETIEWRYLQYLSGDDVPLRTNLEMVRVLKQWNGLSHTHLVPFDEMRLLDNKPSPVHLFKSSLSAIISREAAQVMVDHPKAKELLAFLRSTKVADESFWSSALGNPDVLPVPGAFNATAFMAEKSKHESSWTKYPPRNCPHGPCLTRGFVARYQEWRRKWRWNGHCKGIFTHNSCVFGVGDLPALIANAAFVAHKLYIEHEPATLVCMLNEIKRRREHPDARFDAVQYNHLPQIEFARGVALEDLTRIDLIGSA